MPAYHYAVINPQGKEQKGVIEADSEKHARQLLREKSLIPLHVQITQEKKLLNAEKKSPASFSSFQFFRARRLNNKELALMTRQLATLLSAGLPLEEALFAASEQSEKEKVTGLILSVRSKVLEGHSLAAALREHPTSFSALYVATVAAGEKSGFLDKVLLRLADYTEQQWRLRRKLNSALIYPAMIVLVAVGIVGFLLQYVVPKMIAVYGNLGQALPLLTKILINMSQFIQSYGLYILMVMVLAIFLWRRAIKKNEALREKTHYVLLRLPLIGHAIRTIDTARFARTLSILTAAGVSVLEAMTISAQLIGNIPIKKSVQTAVDHVREGAAIYLSLKQTTFFSPMAVHMIASGEASGQLENMLERVAENQEDEITRLIDVGLALFEPAIILIMGAIVLFIVLAVLLPIFELNQFTG